MLTILLASDLFIDDKVTEHVFVILKSVAVRTLVIPLEVDRRRALAFGWTETQVKEISLSLPPNVKKVNFEMN
jgi:hypothetical protein